MNSKKVASRTQCRQGRLPKSGLSAIEKLLEPGFHGCQVVRGVLDGDRPFNMGVQPVIPFDHLGLSVMMVLRGEEPSSRRGHLVEELLEIPHPLPRFVDQVNYLPWIPILLSRVDRPLRGVSPA